LLAGALGLGFAPRFDKIRKTDDFRPDETFLQVGVDRPGCFPGARPFADRPRAILFAADRQEADVARLLEGPEQ
jgi:hypothetical protein